MTLAVALLAAGRGRRMRGRDKLLEEVDGRPLLRRIAEQALAASVGPVSVTLPPEDGAREAALGGLTVVRIAVADADEGMSASLRAAARWAQESGADGLMVCPADLPDLTAADFRRLARAFAEEGPPLRATAADGAPGHPVLFPARLLAEFAALSGDTGARDLLRAHPPLHVALPATHATTDLDTPEAWDAWRARTGTTPQR